MPQWTPAALRGQGLQLWLSAPDESGGYADGAAVGSAQDFSGNNRNPAGAGSVRPVFKLGVLKGRNAYRFDGIDDLLTTVGGGFTMSTVGLYIFAKVNNTTTLLAEHGPGTGDTNYIASTSATNSFSATVSRGGVTSSYSAQTVNWAVSAGGCILAQEFLGTHATHTIYRDSLTPFTVLTFSGLNGNPGTGNSTSQTYNVGGRASGGFFTSMDLGELVLVSPVTNATTRAVIQYYSRRWNTTLL